VVGVGVGVVVGVGVAVVVWVGVGVGVVVGVWVGVVVVVGPISIIEDMMMSIDILDFEELAAEILGITDDQREDEDYLPEKFYEKFGIDFDSAYEFAKALLPHTVPIKAGLTENLYHAFVSRGQPFMLMKLPAEQK